MLYVTNNICIKMVEIVHGEQILNHVDDKLLAEFGLIRLSKIKSTIEIKA